jgi:hypothetical protein
MSTTIKIIGKNCRDRMAVYIPYSNPNFGRTIGPINQIRANPNVSMLETLRLVIKIFLVIY